MPTTESQGAALYWELDGDGPGLVLAHGAGGNTLSWWQQIPHFVERWSVLRFDHRGFGRSSCPTDAVQPRFFADDLRAILDAAGIERVALVCQSMGGWTGLRFALRWPERVSCLVLCGTPGGVLTEGILQGLAEAARQMGQGGAVASAALAPDFPKRRPDMAQLYASISGLNPPLQDLPVGGLLIQTRVEPDELEGFTVPTLVIAGEHDSIFPPSTLHEVGSLIPGARVLDFPGSGHSTYFEDPERFNRVVGEFVAEHGA
jgi:pimeloyl-ACP methyl ester carboxylesterase